MNYDEALKRWGAKQIGAEDWNMVEVDFDIDEGYPCCDGNKLDCYCSFAESPSFNVEIYQWVERKRGKPVRKLISSRSLQYEMHDFLRELFEVSE